MTFSGFVKPVEYRVNHIGYSHVYRYGNVYADAKHIFAIKLQITPFQILTFRNSGSDHFISQFQIISYKEPIIALLLSLNGPKKGKYNRVDFRGLL